MIQVSLGILGSSIPIPPDNSIAKYIVKTFWCTQQIEDDGEQELYFRLPEISLTEYSRQKESGSEITLFIEVWYVTKKIEERNRLDSIFVGLARYSLNELIDCPYMNPAIKYLDVERIFENYCIGKLYLRISTVIHSDKEMHPTNYGSLFSISTKSDPPTSLSIQQIKNFPPEFKRRIQEVLLRNDNSSHVFDTENQNGSNIPKDSGDDNNAGDDDDDDEFKLNKQSQVSKQHEYGRRKIPVPTTKITQVKTQSPSLPKNHTTNSSHYKIDSFPKKPPPVQKNKALNTIVSNETNNNVLKANNSPRSKLKTITKTPIKVPHAVAHDLLTSPDFPFHIPAVQAVEKKLQVGFAKTPCKDNGTSQSNGRRISDSPPLFRYTPFANHHRDDYSNPILYRAESPYQSDIKNHPRTKERREPLETSAEELVAFLNESFSKTYGDRVEEIRMKNKDLNYGVNSKRHENSTQKKNEQFHHQQQQQKPSKLTMQNHDQQFNHQPTKSKDNNTPVPSSIKLIYSSTRTNGNQNNNGVLSSTSIVPGMQITKYKPSDRSEKLIDPFRSPSKRRMAANFPES